MPGTMDNNLRLGNLKEDLGLYLLRGLAAVAPVPRTQDIGLDAIATLLRPISGRRLIADLSFYVQLKASSEQTVCYDGQAIEWLRELRLPFLIGSVEGKGRISLYTCHRAFFALHKWNYQRLKLQLDQSPSQDEDSCIREEQLGKDPTGKSAIVWLGSPILSWNTADMMQPNFLYEKHKVLKPTLEIMERNAKRRNIRYMERFTWEKETPPTVFGFAWRRIGLEEIQTIDDLWQRLDRRGSVEIAKESSPYLLAWAFHAAHNKKEKDWKILLPILERVKEEGGIPSELLESLKNMAKQRLKLPIV